jgi:hypothetical protein
VSISNKGVTPAKQIGVDSGQDLSRESQTEAIVGHDGGQGVVVIADSNVDGG